MKYKSQKVAYWFFALSMLLLVLQITYGFIMGFARMGYDGLHEWIPFNTARSTHINLLVVWLLSGFMGAAYYIIPEESETELWSTKWAYVQLISLALVGVITIIGFHYNFWAVFGWDAIEGRKFLDAALYFASEGDFSVPGSNKKVSFNDALYIYSTLSMILDYDDYIFMGHTGHSAVWDSLLTSILNNKSSKEFLNGVVIGNEAGGRVGGSVLLGNQNGQMWSYLHGINSVLIFGKLSEMSFETILGGLGNYLYQPHNMLSDEMFSHY